MSSTRLQDALSLDKDGRNPGQIARRLDADACLTGLARETLEDNERLQVENKLLKSRILDLERAADTDPLVAVYNRRAFMRELVRAQTVMARYDIASSLIYFDLNGFKAINDRYGHGIGDDLLKMTGHTLVGGVRECDMVARLGGDEFGVLLFKTDMDVAKKKAAALADRVANNTIEMPTGQVFVTATWGVSPCESDMTPDEILARADRAMYEGKAVKRTVKPNSVKTA